MSDEQFLRHAVRLAAEHVVQGDGGPFGAVVVKDGRVIAEGWNQVTSTNDPTAHAEVVAIRRAAAALGSFELKGAVLYASCEPCPMCLAATYWARLDRLVYASSREDAARAGFDDSLIYEEVPKPVEARRLPTSRLILPEADAAFQAWADKADRVRY